LARVFRSLVLLATPARYSQDLPDFPWGFTAAEIEAQLDDTTNRWGEGALFELFNGEASDVPGAREMFGRLQRSMMSPAMAKLWWQALTEVDVRAVLRSVRAPTLVMARPGDQLVPIEAAAALAADIPNAAFHSLPPGAHNMADITDQIASLALNFICDAPTAPADEGVLKTVMFHRHRRFDRLLSARGGRTLATSAGQPRPTRRSHALPGTAVSAPTTPAMASSRCSTAPTKAVRCALDLVPALATRQIPIRSASTPGECERRGQEWSGMAVHTGARIGALASAGEVLTSRNRA